MSFEQSELDINFLSVAVALSSFTYILTDKRNAAGKIEVVLFKQQFLVIEINQQKILAISCFEGI